MSSFFQTQSWFAVPAYSILVQPSSFVVIPVLLLWFRYEFLFDVFPLSLFEVSFEADNKHLEVLTPLFQLFHIASVLESKALW